MNLDKGQRHWVAFYHDDTIMTENVRITESNVNEVLLDTIIAKTSGGTVCNLNKTEALTYFAETEEQASEKLIERYKLKIKEFDQEWVKKELIIIEQMHKDTFKKD